MVKDETPVSKKKIISLVSAMFIPVSMWTINVILVVQQVLQGNLVSSLISGLVAGLLIFFIERNIIMSNGSKAIMLFRVFLGFIIAILGSLAFDEIIFKNDIDQQLAENKSALIKSNQESIRIKYLPQVESQQELVLKKYNIWVKSLEDAKKESAAEEGTMIPGVGPITKFKMSIAKINEIDYLNGMKELDQLKRKRLEEQQGIEGKIEKSVKQNAMLHRIQGMFELVRQNGMMMLIYCIVTAFLFMLEFIVVLLKVYLPITNYEKKIKLIEEIGERRMEKLRNHDEHYYDFGRIQSMKSGGRVVPATSNVFSTFKHN
jgi:hypothetical protein